MKQRHAVRTEHVLEVNGKPVGSGLSVSYEDGPPDFGMCQWNECDDKATAETALGLQFCEKHFAEFYSS